jgi:hypothetical protein
VEKVEIKNSRWKYWTFLFISLGFVAAGIGMVFDGEIYGWTGILLFGGCALVFIRQLIDSRTRLIIDQNGIFDRTMGVGIIHWEEIENAYVMSISGNDFICLELTNPEKYTRKLSKVKQALASANHSLGVTDLSLNLSGVDASTEDVFEVVIKYCELSRQRGARFEIEANHQVNHNEAR